ncbi:MAG: polysaccharide deacetylase family protein [Steroidobacteraceae bacterium]
MSPAPRRWRRSPWLRATAVWHGAAVLLTLYQPRWWPWTLAAVVANHLLLIVLGLVPRSHVLGSNWTRLPGKHPGAAGGSVAITIDDGPDPQITPQVLQILAAHGARATFFCIGQQAERFPELAGQCVAAGHALENHSYAHPLYFALLGPRRLRREIEHGQRVIAQASGTLPRFFRAPAGLRSPWLDPVLQRLGLQLVSWTRRGFDTVSTEPARVLARLTRNLRAGDILLLHDGHAAHGRDGEAVILEVLPRLLNELAQRGLRTVTLREWLPTVAPPASIGQRPPSP